MDKLIKWVPYEQPKTREEKIGGKVHAVEVSGYLHCSDERVERIWLVGGNASNWTPENNLMSCSCEMIMKNGERHSFENDGDFSKAEAFLKSL